MLSPGPATRIYLAAGVTDMRKSFDGLFALTRSRLGKDPLEGHLYLFCNRRRDRLKILCWDGSGLWVKRLEKGTFGWPQSGQTGRKTAKKASKPRGPKPLNPNLPRIHEQVAGPDLSDLICRVTGKLMRPAMVQSIEVLARKPAEYYVRVLNRNVYVSEADTAPVYHPWPNGVMPRSRVDASLIASVLVQCFADHQPYYRQCEQLGRLGLEMTPNTLMSIARVATEYLSPLYESLRGVSE